MILFYSTETYFQWIFVSVDNPCSDDPCGPDSECINAGHIATCSCLNGYKGPPPNCKLSSNTKATIETLEKRIIQQNNGSIHMKRLLDGLILRGKNLNKLTWKRDYFTALNMFKI